MKHSTLILPLLGLLFLGAGCALQTDSGEGLSGSADFDIVAIEAELGMNLPADTRITQKTNLGDLSSVIGLTATPEQTLLNDFHSQIAAAGYVLPAQSSAGAPPTASSYEGQPAVASYARTAAGSNRPQFFTITVGEDSGETQFLIQGSLK
jgi:hypothetical protein